jgi:hypothetical protein
LPPGKWSRYRGGMNFPAKLILLPLLLTTACSSVKVNRLSQERYPKIAAKDVQQVSPEEAKRRPHAVLAEISMGTNGRFASDLNAIARQRAGKLGGNAYLVTTGESHTTVSGGFTSLFGDATSATMNAQVLRWQEQPAAPATNEKPKNKRHWFWF